MTMPTERLRELNCLECGGKDPNCDAIVLGPRCHPGAGVRVKAGGRLVGLHCFVCDKHIAALQAPLPIVREGKTVPCHGDGLFAVYRKPTHSIVLKCASCEAVVGTLWLPQPN